MGLFDKFKKNKSNGFGFKYLKELIEGSNEIVLDNDIMLVAGEETEFPEGIVLDKNIVIDGNGHAIDAKGKAQIFRCTAKKVAIKNITLKNGFCEDSGGAIVNDEGELLICKSTFKDNRAGNWSGAIQNNKGRIKIIESRLTNNTVERSGGAIGNDRGDLKIIKCSLKDNKAIDDGGGAINNYATAREESTVDISQSTFSGNSAKWGGAIYNFMGTSKISESRLEKNTAEDSGAVMSNRGKVIITESEISKNTGTAQSGAITNYMGDLKIIDSAITHNNANMGSGAIDNDKERSFTSVNCKFENNNPRDFK